MSNKLEVIPNQEKVSRPLFSSQDEYDRFRETYMDAVIPELERLREARMKSELESHQRIVK